MKDDFSVSDTGGLEEKIRDWSLNRSRTYDRLVTTVLMPYRNATWVSAFKFKILKTIYHVIIIGLRRWSAPGGLLLHFLGESSYMQDVGVDLGQTTNSCELIN